MSVAAPRNLNADLTQALGSGTCCYWEPGYMPSDSYLVFERILDLVISDALEDNGFDQMATFTQRGATMALELLGPDSPSEYVMEWELVKREGTPEDIEAMRQQMIQVNDWIQERGEAYRQQPLGTINPVS